MTYQHIYVAGPMRGYPAFNFPAFFEAEARLRKMFPAAHIKNPARMDAERSNLLYLLDRDPTGRLLGEFLVEHFDQSPDSNDLREALTEDLAFVAGQADLVALLPGWRQSKGATAEAAAAHAVGIKVAEFQREENAVFTEESAEPVATFEADYLAPAMSDPAVAGWEQADRDWKAHQQRSEAVSSPSQPSDGYEVRTVSESGGEKGAKPAQFDQIPPDALWRLAEHFGKGARKYDAHNFRKGYKWSLSYNAAVRHLLDFWAGRDWDVCPPNGQGCLHREGEVYPTTEHGPTCFNHTGSHHLDAFMWHAVVLRTFYDEHKEYDDRYVSTKG